MIIGQSRSIGALTFSYLKSLRVGDLDLMWDFRYLCLISERFFFITVAGFWASPYNGSFFGDELLCARLFCVGDGVLAIFLLEMAYFCLSLFIGDVRSVTLL